MLCTNYHQFKKLPYYKRTYQHLTRIPYPTYEVSSHVLLPWDVFHSKEEFLDCYRPPTCRYSLNLLIPHITARH